MKTLYIALLIFALQLSIFGQLLNENLYLSNTVSSDSNFVPLQVGNTWQFMQSSYGPFGYGYALKYSTVNSDTIVTVTKLYLLILLV